MKLLNNLYTISSTTVVDELPIYTLSLNPDDVIYKAHFPDMPITPGVCIVQMCQEVLEKSLNKPLLLVKAKNVKFLSVINPLEVSSIRVAVKKVEQVDDETKAQFQVLDDEKVYAKLSLVFK